MRPGQWVFTLMLLLGVLLPGLAVAQDEPAAEPVAAEPAAVEPSRAPDAAPPVATPGPPVTGRPVASPRSPTPTQRPAAAPAPTGPSMTPAPAPRPFATPVFAALPVPSPSPVATATLDQDWIHWAVNYVTDPDGLVIKGGLGLLMLAVGWLVAWFLGWLTYRALIRTTWDDWIAEKLGLSFLLEGDDNRLERTVGKAVYWLVLLTVFVGVLDYAGLSQAAGPIQSFIDTIAQALPLVGKAALILGGAWLLGTGLSRIVTTALDKAGVDKRFAELSHAADEDAQADEDSHTFSQNAGRVVFWLIMVIGLAGAFEALEIGPLAEPLRNAMDQIIGVLPDVGFAAIILGVGYVGGRIARTVLQNLLQSVGLDKLSARIKLDALLGDYKASQLVGLLAHLFIMFQALIAAMNQLGLETLSEPLTQMMTRVWELLPNVALAGVVVAAGVVVGRILRVVATRILKNLGLDRFMASVGFGKLTYNNEDLDEPSELAGLAVQVAVVLVAVVQGLEILGLATWAGYVSTFLEYAVQNVLVALLIVGIGFVVGEQVSRMIQSRTDQDPQILRWLGGGAKYAVLVFAFTMAIRHLEVADDFVLVTFSLLFGGLVLAVSLAFGLGAREVAGEIVRDQYNRTRDRLDHPNLPEEETVVEGDE